MTVLLPTNGAPTDEEASGHTTLEQVSAGEAALERVAPEPRGRQVVIAVEAAAATEVPAPTQAPTLTEPATEPVPVAPARAAAVRPVLTAAPVVVAPPAPCPATFFCYPRLGIAGAILPYNDCAGTTDVGQAIRQLSCVRAGIWLAGHASTQFGGITGYRVGDVVFIGGQRFEITGASVQRSCAPTTQAIAPLSLQTSLEAATCGRVLVVQGR
jgi:hypothetical protein